MKNEEKRNRGRPRSTGEQITARFPSGTLARVSAVLRDKETQAEFIRIAVAKEVKRRSS